MPDVIFTVDSRHGARGEVAGLINPSSVERAVSAPLLTWADWELLQALHKERADSPAEPAPEADRHAPVESYESICRRMRHAAEERDRALVQVTVYRKAYYNLLQALSTGPSMQATLNAVRIIDAAVKDHENQ